MNEFVGVILILVVVGFIADLNSGAIVGGLLAARTGKREGLSFLSGMTAARLIQLAVGATAVVALLSQFLGRMRLDRLTWFLLGLVGLAAIVLGLRAALRPPAQGRSSQEDGGGGITPKAAFITGFAITIISLKQWIFTSFAVAAIGTLRAEWLVYIGLIVFYLLVSSWLVVGLLILRLVRPNQALGIIDRLARWTDANLGRIAAWLGIVLGVLLFGIAVWKLFG